MKNTNTTNQANTNNNNNNVKEQNTMTTNTTTSALTDLIKNHHITVITTENGKTRKKQNLSNSDFVSIFGNKDDAENGIKSGRKVRAEYIDRIRKVADACGKFAVTPDATYTAAVSALQTVYNYLTVTAGLPQQKADKTDIKYIMHFNTARKLSDDLNIIIDEKSIGTYQRLIEDCLYFRLNGIRPDYKTAAAKMEERKAKAAAKKAADKK